MTPTPAYCPVCGQPSPGGAIHATHASGGGTPSPSPPTAKPAKKSNNAAVGCLAIVVVLLVVGYASGAGKGSSGGSSGGNSGANHLTGKFVDWVPVDEANGYAFFSITNSGTSTETATCTIRVKNDFGNFGFDYLVGEEVGPGQTVTGKLPLRVGEGSFLINHGEVTDC